MAVVLVVSVGVSVRPCGRHHPWTLVVKYDHASHCISRHSPHSRRSRTAGRRKGTTVDGHGGERDCTGRLSTGVLTHAVSPHSGRVFSSLYTIGDDEVGEKMKFHYCVAGSVCRCAVHHFRSRVQNEREKWWRKTVEWRRRVSMQYVPLHVLSSKSCISTPEI